MYKSLKRYHGGVFNGRHAMQLEYYSFNMGMARYSTEKVNHIPIPNKTGRATSQKRSRRKRGPADRVSI